MTSLSPCTTCGRLFALSSVVKHSMHCRRPKKTLKFNAKLHYLLGTPSEAFLKSARVGGFVSKLGKSKIRSPAIGQPVESLRRTSLASLVKRARIPDFSSTFVVEVPNATPVRKASRGIDVLEFLELVPREECNPVGIHPLEQPRPRTVDRKIVVPQFSSPKKSPEKRLNRYDKAAEAVKAKSTYRETMISSRRQYEDLCFQQNSEQLE